jgi:hypothetical protein
VSMDSATIKFQQYLPFAILSVSPSLAALHKSRVRRLSPDSCAPNSPHCSKCGSFLLNGDGKVRAIRRNKRGLRKDEGSFRISRWTCRTCGWIDDIPMERGNAALFTRQFKGATVSMQHPAANVEVKGQEHYLSGSECWDGRPECGCPSSSSSLQPVLPHSALPARVFTPPPARSNSRPKKRSGLHHMLSRNRETEEKERLRKLESQSGGGLAAFLNGL